MELTAEVESETADYDSSNNHDEVIVDKKVKVSFYSEGELLEENIYQAGEVLEFPFSQDGSGRNLNLVYNKNYKLPAAAEHVRELIIEKYELQKQSLQ